MHLSTRKKRTRNAPALLARGTQNLYSFEIPRANRILFLLFVATAINGIAWQVTFPYLLIYIEHYLGYDKGTMGWIMGGVLMITALSTIPLGILVDRIPRRTFILWNGISSSRSNCIVIFSFARGILLPFGGGCSPDGDHGCIWHRGPVPG